MSQGILFYQIVIFSIILIAARFGSAAFNRTTIALVLYTFIHVFMPWLMLLQFGTIFVAYSLGKSLVARGSDSDSPVHAQVTEARTEVSRDVSKEQTDDASTDLCVILENNEVVEERGAYSGKGRQNRDISDGQDVPKLFDSFKAASAFAKENPGTKVTRDKDGRFLVTR